MKGRNKKGQFISGPEHPNWKGDNVGREALHDWVTLRKPKPEFCEICKSNSPLDLANITDDYSRELHNWQWQCRRCHMKSDGRLEANTQRFTKTYQGKITFTCDNCQKESERNRSCFRANRKKGMTLQFCSIECRDQGLKYEKHQCIFCGNEIVRWQTDKEALAFCNQYCRQKYERRKDNRSK